ncbi:hypothetical protein CHS0354_012745 [Potamilus streckersoni]|uniref:Uncharacterized protein n=1 Tax=Potamilus streckersoni TaxID=2493646 RepID=A0AAE0SXU2_9BIVA|nr:hypothetical protein CHS0354_012745 [Potamilus streckersoni]
MRLADDKRLHDMNVCRLGCVKRESFSENGSNLHHLPYYTLKKSSNRPYDSGTNDVGIVLVNLDGHDVNALLCVLARTIEDSTKSFQLNDCALVYVVHNKDSELTKQAYVNSDMDSECGS